MLLGQLLLKKRGEGAFEGEVVEGPETREGG